jgi:hypothetical protein
MREEGVIVYQSHGSRTGLTCFGHVDNPNPPLEGKSKGLNGDGTVNPPTASLRVVKTSLR